MSDAIHTNECVKVLENALAETHPSLNVPRVILCTVAEFVPRVCHVCATYGHEGKPRSKNSPNVERIVARFDKGRSLPCFTVSYDGKTATRNARDKYSGYRFVCASPKLTEGKCFRCTDSGGIHSQCDL